MKRTSLAGWIFFAAAFTAAMHAKTETTTDVVTTGTAFKVHDHGYLLSNYHVIKGCKSIIVYRGDTAHTVQVVYSDPQHDLALMIAPRDLEYIARNPAYRTEQIQRLREGTWGYPSEPAPAFRSDLMPYIFRLGFRDTTKQPIKLGENVVVIGYPLAGIVGGINVTTGNISALTGLGGDSRHIQITAPVQAGNSGGPLLDADSHVIGVVVSKLNVRKMEELTGDIPQNVNFAIRGDIVRDFLSSYMGEWETLPSESTVKQDTAEIANWAKDFTFPVVCQR